MRFPLVLGVVSLLLSATDVRLLAVTVEEGNRYLERIDAAVRDPKLREVLHRVQPACVRIGGGSGVNVHPDGYVLTNAHVAGRKGATFKARFPDGEVFSAECVAIDRHLDLALCRLKGGRGLPVAPIADEPPAQGDRVVCIGNPGPRTPSGKATGYRPFHVSVGSIRGFNGNPLGSQKLGRTRHDAWTYWGHSGSPLFNDAGKVVALHNSWDSTTSLRRAVPLQAIQDFLRRALDEK